jgi:lyso-ornithine lipid O-acyltransferase
MVRSLWLVLLLLSAVVDTLLRRPRTSYEGAVRMHGLCRRIVHAMGVECSVEGGLPAYGAVVSNHLSYLDILVFGSLRPFVMVAKSEVRSWPLIGRLAANAGTVFVVRGGGPPTWPSVNAAMAAAYRSGLPVLFFPEGTTSDGSTVLPFRRGLFHSVLNEGVPLRVAGLGFSIAEGGASIARDVCWWGDALLAPHLFRLLGLPRIRAEVEFGAEVTERDDRFVLSQTARARVAELAQISENAEVAEPARERLLVEAT